jgi:hypothetical protein
LNFASIPPLWGSLGRIVVPSLGKEVDLKLCTRGGLRGTPLGLLRPLGERGGHPHNNRGLPNNSKIKDFYRAKIIPLTAKITRAIIPLKNIFQQEIECFYFLFSSALLYNGSMIPDKLL